jgi:hypothetical protein
MKAIFYNRVNFLLFTITLSLALFLIAVILEIIYIKFFISNIQDVLNAFYLAYINLVVAVVTLLAILLVVYYKHRKDAPESFMKGFIDSLLYNFTLIAGTVAIYLYYFQFK